jgi:hypothetical protein
MITTLSNGKKVGNFSSPHEFVFTDGTVLPAVSNALAEKLKVKFNETKLGDGDIELSFSLSKEINKDIYKWMELYESKQVNVVFCPLPMITAMKQSTWFGKDFLKNSPFRSIRIEDRIKKLVSIDKQCL